MKSNKKLAQNPNPITPHDTMQHLPKLKLKSIIIVTKYVPHLKKYDQLNKPPTVTTHLQIDKSTINQKGHIIACLGFLYRLQQQQPVLSPKNEACAVLTYFKKCLERVPI